MESNSFVFLRLRLPGDEVEEKACSIGCLKRACSKSLCLEKCHGDLDQDNERH